MKSFLLEIEIPLLHGNCQEFILGKRAKSEREDS